MRTSVASLSKKIVSTFFAATLALGLVPIAAFADDGAFDGADAIGSPSEEPIAEGTDPIIVDADGSNPVVDASASGEDVVEDAATTGDDVNLGTPVLGGDIINQEMPLSTVAQAESTRSYFLAQTLESTKTVPVVSAKLPLDSSGTNQGSQAGVDGGQITVGSEDKVTDGDLPTASTEAGSSDEPEGGEGSDESDLADAVTLPGVAAESTVVGSFTYLGMTFAVEPGGESVALVAVDYFKLPEEFVQKQVIVIPDMATPDGLDYYSVTRIADNAFASLTKETANPDYTGCIELFSDEELLAEAGIDPADVVEFLADDGAAAETALNDGAITSSADTTPVSSDEEAATEADDGASEVDGSEEVSFDDIRTIVSMDGNVATLDDGSTYTFTNPLAGCAGILALGIPASVSSIGDEAFSGFETLQYLVVSDNDPEYASYDGALYSADLTNLRLIPEGRVGAVRVASSATSADPEVFSHCPSVDALVADAGSEAWKRLEADIMHHANDDRVFLVGFAGVDVQPGSRTQESSTLLADSLNRSVSALCLAGLLSVPGYSAEALFADGFENRSSASASQTLTNTELALYATDANGTTIAMLRGRITSGSLTTYTYQDASSPPKEQLVYSVYITRFSPYMKGDIAADGSAVTADYDAASVLKRFDDAAGCTISAFWFTDCGSILSRAQLNSLAGGNQTAGIGLRLSTTSLTYSNTALISNKTLNGYSPYKYVMCSACEVEGYLDGDGGLFSGGVPFLNIYGATGEKWNGFPSTPPTRAGYTFQKYENASGETTSASSNIAKHSSYHYYARWLANTYSITYNGNGSTGGSTASTPATYDQNVTLASNGFTRTGHTFKEWNTAADGSGVGYAAAATLTKPNFVTSGSKTLYAIWAPNTYSITWNMNGHGTAPSKTSYTYGDTYTLPSVSATGYTFGGWYTNSACTTAASNITSTTTGNKTFYAKWTANTYSITYNGNGSTGGSTASTSATYDQNVTLASNGFTRTGHTFKEWNTAADGSGVGYAAAATLTKPNFVTSGSKTLYAIWKPNTYSITWNMQGHGTAPSKDSYTYGDTYTLPTVASVTGYTFGGWYTNSACIVAASNITSTTTGDKAFYAKWTVNSHKVYWKYDGAEGKTDSEESVSYGASFTMKDPGNKPGYKFAGWKASGADANTYDSGASFTMKDGEVTFTAQWSRNEYTAVNLSDERLGEGVGIIWHWPGKGYVDSESSTVVKSKGEHIVTPPVVSGYEFLGWYDTQDENENTDAHKMIDASGALCTDVAPSASVTWWAHWKRVSCPVVLTASYDDIPYVTEAGEASIPYARFGEPFSSSIEGGRLKALPRRTGYTFMGYFTEKNPEVSSSDASEERFAGTAWIDREGRLTSNIWDLYPAEERGSVTLYAAWRLDDCRVIFDAVSGTPSNTESVTVVNESVLAERAWNYGKPKGYLPVPSDLTFYRHGYVFSGWYYLEGDERVLVSDGEGNPTPEKWLFEKDSIVLHPIWTARTYTLAFDPAYPDIEGVPSESPEPTIVDIAYDTSLDLAVLVPSFDPFTFVGWYTETDQSFEGAHMTDGRFTPRGSLAQQDPIRLRAAWREPGKSTYTLYVGMPGGTELVSERPYEYRYTETIVFNGTEAPVSPSEGYRFAGWVEVESDAAARAMVASGGPTNDASTTPGFGPLSTRSRFFVAKWTSVPLSTALLSVPSDEGSSWLLSSDRLIDHEGEGIATWSEACAALGVERPDLARSLSYDVMMKPFVLPDVQRKGHAFEGWVLQGTNAAPERGIVVDPASQVDLVDERDLVYVPVFEEAFFTIILDGNGLGEEMRFEGVAYGDSFSFPYPSTLETGSCFACWASAPNTVSSTTETFFPEDAAPLAPSYDESGIATSFGLAELADENNTIILYAVWNAPYSVEVPLFANMAIDTESGDMIAGTNALKPKRTDETDALYQVESIRYEPMNDDGVPAFEGEAGIYLSVYAGLSVGDASEESLLSASKVGEGGILSYTDEHGLGRTAHPLLITLGRTASLYTRTAPDGSPSLDGVTDPDVPCGFLPFGASSPLTVRYGLLFDSGRTPGEFAYGSARDWTLPDNDGANMAASEDPRDPDYGRREGWSGDSVPVARLRYTVSML